MEFIDELKDFLLANIPRSKLASGGKEILSRCQFCGDSHNMSDAHFYISLGYSTNGIIFYNCFKCGECGVLTTKTLRDIGIYDDSVNSALNKYNKEVLSSAKNRMYKDIHIAYLRNTFIRQCKETDVKIKYINKRLGLNFTKQDLINNKIVLNLKDILKENNINEYTRSDFIIDQLDEVFIGFLSADNCSMNMRNLLPGKTHKSIIKRYVNYNIFTTMDNSKRYYILPTEVDIFKTVKIHIAEGPFDILSIKYNLRKDEDNAIFASIGGKAYLNIIRYFICVLGLVNIELHIYPDSDISDWDISNIVNFVIPFNLDIYIHRNVYPEEKDFGVAIEKIDESVYRINKKRALPEFII